MNIENVSPAVRFQGVSIKEVSGGEGRVYVKLTLDNEGEPDLDEFKRDPNLSLRMIPGTDDIEFESKFNPFGKNSFNARTDGFPLNSTIGQSEKDYGYLKRIPGLLDKVTLNKRLRTFIDDTLVPARDKAEALWNRINSYKTSLMNKKEEPKTEPEKSAEPVESTLIKEGEYPPLQSETTIETSVPSFSFSVEPDSIPFNLTPPKKSEKG